MPGQTLPTDAQRHTFIWTSECVCVCVLEEAREGGCLWNDTLMESHTVCRERGSGWVCVR